MSEIIEAIEWARGAIRDQSMFGMENNPLQAGRFRERRASAVLLDCKEALQAAKEREAKLRDRVAKLEKMACEIHESCRCVRFKTEGFDYGETHPTLGRCKAGSRWVTPKRLIEKALGFKWKYKDPEKPGHSWKELECEEYDNKKPGYY